MFRVPKKRSMVIFFKNIISLLLIIAFSEEHFKRQVTFPKLVQLQQNLRSLPSRGFLLIVFIVLKKKEGECFVVKPKVTYFAWKCEIDELKSLNISMHAMFNVTSLLIVWGYVLIVAQCYSQNKLQFALWNNTLTYFFYFFVPSTKI